MKQTAVEWLVEQLIFKQEYEHLPSHYFLMSDKDIDNIIKQAKAMEKEQRGYSREDVIKIVEKSRETGLTAEYLLLTYKSE